MCTEIPLSFCVKAMTNSFQLSRTRTSWALFYILILSWGSLGFDFGIIGDPSALHCLPLKLHLSQLRANSGLIVLVRYSTLVCSRYFIVKPHLMHIVLSITQYCYSSLVFTITLSSHMGFTQVVCKFSVQPCLRPAFVQFQ